MNEKARGASYQKYPEIELRLNGMRLYRELRLRAAADSSCDEIMSTLLEAVYFAHNRSKLILDYMPQYTLHDSDHLFRVCEIIGLLLPESYMKNLGIADLYALIICSFFHDLGMAPTRREVDAWRNQLFADFVPKHSNKISISTYIHSLPTELDRLNKLKNSENNEKIRDLRRLEDEIITRFIRDTHGYRAKTIIQSDWSEKFTYRDVDLTGYISLICESHVKNTLEISKDLPALQICGGSETFCPQICAILLRIADLIDFDMKRAPKSLLDAIGVDDVISRYEWSKHRSVNAWKIDPTELQISASCIHPIIQDAIISYCNQINDELSKCAALIDAMPSQASKYHLKLPQKVDHTHVKPKLTPDGRPLYTYHKTRFTLDQDKVVDLLMGTSLYGNPAVALRELLQNSIDACLARQAFETAWDRNFKPRTTIKLDRSKSPHTLTVWDNGIGMDIKIINNFYAKVGSCFYKSPEFYNLLAQNGVNFKSISRFGIGVLSYFLVANRIEVASRRMVGRSASAEPVSVKIDGVSGIFWISDSEMDDIGTETTLLLLTGHPWENKDVLEIRKEIETILPSPSYPISIEIDGFHSEHDKVADSDYSAKLQYGGVLTDYPVVRSRVRSEAITHHDRSNGYSITALISWLEKDNQPVFEFDYINKKVTLEETNQEFSITNSIEARQNRITRWTTSLEVKDDVLLTHNAYSDFMKSNIQMSLHGFNVPFGPFDFSEAGETEIYEGIRDACKLNLPFCLVGSVSIATPGDLNLNAARDNIIPDQEWYLLRNWVVKTILVKLSERLTQKYYRSLLSVWISKTHDDQIRKMLINFLNK